MAFIELPRQLFAADHFLDNRWLWPRKAGAAICALMSTRQRTPPDDADPADPQHRQDQPQPKQSARNSQRHSERLAMCAYGTAQCRLPEVRLGGMGSLKGTSQPRSGMEIVRVRRSAVILWRFLVISRVSLILSSSFQLFGLPFS